MHLSYRQKEVFWLRFSGWFCLFPAAAYLYLYQTTQSWFCLGELIIIVLFAAYILTTAKSERWMQSKNMMRLLIFALIFVAVVVSIPLFFAYRNCKKIQ